MWVSSVLQHIWSLKLRKEDGSALKCMSGLRAGVWWVRLEVLINHTEPSRAFSLSFIPLCRSGDRSGVTLSCNKCFEGRRPDIVLEITRRVYVCTLSHSFSGTDLLFVYYIYSITHTLLLSRKTRINPSSPSLLLCLPNWLQKQNWILTQGKCSRDCQQLTVIIWQWFSVSYWVTVHWIDSPIVALIIGAVISWSDLCLRH